MEAKNENKQKYCKFVIQFNSIQFNSIPKIVFLIALLFILLFLISCSSNEKPTEDNNKERTLSYYAGTWYAQGGSYEACLIINSDGSITHLEFKDGYRVYFDKKETIPATSIKRISDTNFTYSFKNPYKPTGVKNAEISFYNDKLGTVSYYHNYIHESGVGGFGLYK